MFPFLTISIIFMLVLAFFRKRSTDKQNEVQQQFWEQENLANSTLRQDISKLEYISIPLDKLPLSLESEAVETIRALADQKIINLSTYTNTELKLKYGIANLDILSEYESNFFTLEKSLESYASELLAADRSSDAQKILEYVVAIGSDVSNIYLMLAELYKAQDHNDRLSWLIAEASKLKTLTKDSLIVKLNAICDR